MKALSGLMFALALGLCGGEALAQVTDLNSAINKAGRQRMLSQRMAKAYYQVGQQVDSERSRKVLDASVALFDRQLVELKNYAPTPEIRDTYLKLEKVWLEYKDVLLGLTPSPDNGRKVMALSDQVLALAHEGTVLLERRAASSAGHLVNLSGRQRMLSQRMSGYYQALAWGVADPRSAAELDKARREFSSAHQELVASAVNHPEIRDSLELVGQQWVFFDTALRQKSGGDRKAQAAVATTSERILQEMETVVSRYEKLSPSEQGKLALVRR